VLLMPKVIRCDPSIRQEAPPPPAPGLGDVVASATKAVGVQPCGACRRRQEALNAATPGWVRRSLAWIARAISRF
jgi:hypothetical protein